MVTPVIQAELAGQNGISGLIAIVFSWRILLGLFVYFSSAVVWLLVLSKIDVSLAYPFVGLGFILTAILGWLIRGEELSLTRILGTALIISGVFLVARST
jgi:multidrug transporter EmrE-like cation transporter